MWRVLIARPRLLRGRHAGQRYRPWLLYRGAEPRDADRRRREPLRAGAHHHPAHTSGTGRRAGGARRNDSLAVLPGRGLRQRGRCAGGRRLRRLQRGLDGTGSDTLTVSTPSSNDSVTLLLEHPKRPCAKCHEVTLLVADLRLGGGGPAGAVENLALTGYSPRAHRAEEVHVHL